MYLLTVAMCTLTFPPQAPRPPQAPAIPQAVSATTYSQQRAKAISQNKPLVVFVGCDPIPNGNWLTCRVEKMSGVTSRGIVVSEPDSGKLWHLETLSPNATAQDIQSVLGRRNAQSPPQQTFPAYYYAPPPPMFGGFGGGGGRCGPGG